MNQRQRISLIMGITFTTSAAFLFAGQPPSDPITRVPSNPRSTATDDDLTRGLLDDLLPERETPPEGKGTLPLDKAQDGLHETSDPVGKIYRDMQFAAQLMRKSEAAPEVLALQQSIIDRMEEWLRQLKEDLASEHSKSTSRSETTSTQRQSSTQSATTRVLPESVPEPASGGMASHGTEPSDQPPEARSESRESPWLERMRLGEGIWGHLPERTRRESISSGELRFMPKYEQMIQRYYRRFSSEPTPSRPSDDLPSPR